MTGITGSEAREIVDAAERAAAEGRALEAVDALALLAPTDRTPDLEAKIVELRHRAFSELDKRPGRPTWPIEVADPFPTERGVPEIERAQLTGEILGGAILHHGCLRVNGLFDTEWVERLRRIIAQVHEERDLPGQGGTEEPESSWFVPFSPGREKAEGFGRAAFVRVVDVPHALSELVEAFAESGVRDAVTDYFNERPAMIANKWGLRRTAPAEARCPDFHQDGAFLGEGIRTVDGWVALSHCGPGTGAPAMDFVARRFNDVLPPGEGAQFPWSLAEATVRAAEGGAPVVSPVFAPGDALFFDERLVHRTAVGPDTEARFAIESWFVAPSSYPEKHVPVVL